MIQDLAMRNLIRVDKQQQGVYFFKDNMQSRFQVNSAISHDLWHCRMGHPSSQALSLLSPSIHEDFCRSDKAKLCDACIHAKQTRMPFPLSNNKASQIFDLVHCDIWGAYRVS